MRSFLLLLLLATPAAAQDKMSAEEFDAHVTGRTITFHTDINPLYGIEAYLQGRRVMWSAFDGTCKYGVWYESKGDICFRYEDNPEPQCWATYLENGRIRAEFTNVPFGTIIFETDADEPLICNDLSS
ncbi:hypothetical protein [Yoonia vestfoldensis]|uniref:hypothetical protein n=1 Tax=Yoonia vestfoldensis TaxID=245188 RepID=UPI00036B65CD|nr:hypothetical protein [Yoonia vestfoldensis]